MNNFSRRLKLRQSINGKKLTINFTDTGNMQTDSATKCASETEGFVENRAKATIATLDQVELYGKVKRTIALV